MRKTIYTCDRCGLEVGRPSDLKNVAVPARVVNCRTGRIEQVMQEIELCQGCMDELHQLCERQFARVTVSCAGISVDPRNVPVVVGDGEAGK